MRGILLDRRCYFCDRRLWLIRRALFSAVVCSKCDTV